MCEKIPVHRASAVDEKMKKDQSERRDHQHRRNKRGRRSKPAFEFAPPVAAFSFGMHGYCTARVADVPVVMVLRRSCATRFTRMVTPKSTRPISNNAPR